MELRLEREITGKDSWVPVLAIFALSAIVRGLSLADSLSFDEFYNILAARSLVEGGTLAIADGDPYLRARLFTYAVAASMKMFGETLVAARVPSMLFGALWVTVVFVGARRYAGATTAWVAALLLCFDPHAIGLSQIARMYSMHALMFWVGAMLLYGFLRDGQLPVRRGLLAAGALIALGVALHLQRITLIGALSLVLWPLATGLVSGGRGVRRLNWRLLAMVLAAAVAAVAFFMLTDRGAVLVESYRSANARQTLLRIDPRIYFWWLSADYPFLLGLLPLGFLLAFRANRRLALYCGAFFLAAFLFHSAAASRQIRYFHYVLPAFFIIWGLAAQVLLPHVLELATSVVRDMSRALPRTPPALARNSILAATLVFVVAANPATSRTIREVLPRLERPLYGNNFWAEATPALAELAGDENRIVVSSMIPQTLFFLRRGDVEIGLNYRPEADAPPFSRDWRVGTAVISTRPELETLIECYPSGLLIVHGHYWRSAWGVTAAMADLVETEMTPLSLGAPPEDVRAYTWDRPAPAAGSSCPSIRLGTAPAVEEEL